ncbi:hypothetical protein [Marasmitruncus massiliensis]|uniref:hypothetical protein n=1 Tax=Marasmitruncus massiliensis TaxID=1944642 RepID=UPI000C7AC113|nr:hypothetical protein [Marasmitruncus massiliensis]
MSKKWLNIFCCLLLTITLTACNAQSESAAPEENSMSESSISTSSEIEDSSEPSSSQQEVPSSSSEPDQARLDYLNSLNIDSAPVDLNDLEAVTRVYVQPILTNIYFYEWEDASQIKAKDLIDICSYNNFLNLPRDNELCYPPEYSNAPADQVETSIQKHFDVTKAYLETAPQFNAQHHTYELIGGFGGAVWPVAMSAEQQGNQIIIKVGILCAVNKQELQEMGDTAPKALQSTKIIWVSRGALVPSGILTAEIEDEKTVEYSSYQLYDGFEW